MVVLGRSRMSLELVVRRLAYKRACIMIPLLFASQSSWSTVTCSEATNHVFIVNFGPYFAHSCRN